MTTRTRGRDYLQHVRIEEAERLLGTFNQSADEISFEVGYEDASFKPIRHRAQRAAA